MSKKEQILEYFKDINVAYNDYTMHDTLEHMLEDLEEVRHERWMYQETWEVFKCSSCGHSAIRKYPYCMWCGAKMDIDTPTDPVAK